MTKYMLISTNNYITTRVSNTSGWYRSILLIRCVFSGDEGCCLWVPTVVKKVYSSSVVLPCCHAINVAAQLDLPWLDRSEKCILLNLRSVATRMYVYCSELTFAPMKHGIE